MIIPPISLNTRFPNFCSYSQPLDADHFVDLTEYIMRSEQLGSFALFLVDREVIPTASDYTRLSVCDIVKNLIIKTNQENLFGRAKVMMFQYCN